MYQLEFKTEASWYSFIWMKVVFIDRICSNWRQWPDKHYLVAMGKKNGKKKKKKKESSLLKTLTHSYIFIWGGNHSFLLTSVSLLELVTYKQFFPSLPAPILIGKVPWNCPKPWPLSLFTLEHPERWSPRAVERRERFNKPQLVRSFVPEQRKFTKTFVPSAKVEKL